MTSVPKVADESLKSTVVMVSISQHGISGNVLVLSSSADLTVTVSQCTPAYLCRHQLQRDQRRCLLRTSQVTTTLQFVIRQMIILVMLCW